MTAAEAPIAAMHALADETRWAILVALGARDRSASDLARELPVSRQAIAKHIDVLSAAGLVTSVRVGREVHHRALGARLQTLAGQLDAIARGWDRRLDRLAALSEQRASHSAPPL